MPILVHITSDVEARAAVRAGLRAASGAFDTPRGVYCMPMLPSYFATHQWHRELKRRGRKIMTAVDFRLPDDDPVWFGRYSGPHRETTVGRAIGDLLRERDPRGFELIVPRRILPREILRLRTPHRVVGWRYRPDAHGKPLCPCRVCLPRGAPNSRRTRRRLDPTGERY